MRVKELLNRLLGRLTNCVNCVLATDNLLAGRPAAALPALKGEAKGASIRVIEKIFGRSFGRKTRDITEITKQLEALGPGSRGIVAGFRGGGRGHVFNVANQGGEIRYLDGQSAGAAKTEGFEYFRLIITSD